MVDRHDVLVNEFVPCFQSTGASVKNNTNHTRGSGPMKLRPDLDGWDFPNCGDRFMADILVTNPARPSVLHQSQGHPLAAATAGERGKLNKYSQLATDENKHLYALAFEASGAFGKGVSFLLSRLAARADPVAFEASSEDRTWASHTWNQWWTQRLACAFWRGSAIMFQRNASAMRSRDPRSPQAGDEEEDEEEHGPARASGPKMGCAFYQAPPLHSRQAHLPHNMRASAPPQQPSPFPPQAAASHSAAAAASPPGLGPGLVEGEQHLRREEEAGAVGASV